MNQLLKKMEEKGITWVRLLVIDIEGHPKFMIIPRSFLAEAGAGIGIDGSSIPGFTTVNESDLIAKPDVEHPFFLEDEVVLFCDVEYKDGRQFEGDPRGILRKVLTGNTFYVKPELEFFLIRDGVPIDNRGYMDAAHGLTLVETACNSVNAPIERVHHENGPGQYEIEPVIAPALAVCDTIILLKEMVKKKASLHGMTATFMPKPFMGEAGSGMHFHVLLEKNGQNLFESPSQGLSETALHFIGGLLAHARGITAICDPTINSYKRLVPHFEAPVHITWGRGNRSTLVRIPQGGRTRIEYRAPDPSCNPYLALAAILGSGLEGIHKKVEPPQEMTGNVFEMSELPGTLPTTLAEALTELEKDELVTTTMGEHIIQQFITLKRKEIKEYNTQVSQWELDNYMEC